MNSSNLPEKKSGKLEITRLDKYNIYTTAVGRASPCTICVARAYSTVKPAAVLRVITSDIVSERAQKVVLECVREVRRGSTRTSLYKFDFTWCVYLWDV